MRKISTKPTECRSALFARRRLAAHLEPTQRGWMAARVARHRQPGARQAEQPAQDKQVESPHQAQPRQVKLALVQEPPIQRPVRCQEPKGQAHQQVPRKKPPPTPYQRPVYKKGRRTKGLLPPTNFTITISSRRFSIARRMVFPRYQHHPLKPLADRQSP